MLLVPTTAATVTNAAAWFLVVEPEVVSGPPAGDWQMIWVLLTHSVFPQMVLPRRAVALVGFVAKFTPSIVRLVLPLVAPLNCIIDEITGASNEKTPWSVPTTAPTLIVPVIFDPVPAPE